MYIERVIICLFIIRKALTHLTGPQSSICYFILTVRSCPFLQLLGIVKVLTVCPTSSLSPSSSPMFFEV